MVNVEFRVKGRGLNRGFRSFLAAKALVTGIDRIYAENVSSNEIVVRAAGRIEKLELLPKLLSTEWPEEVTIASISPLEVTNSAIVIPTISEYVSVLTAQEAVLGTKAMKEIAQNLRKISQKPHVKSLCDLQAEQHLSDASQHHQEASRSVSSVGRDVALGTCVRTSSEV